MIKINGRTAFLRLLATEGVEYLFGNPGTTELAIMEALGRQSEINYVLGLQESVVVAMADGYARASGRIGACNVHVASGLGNAMGALYNAKFAGSRRTPKRPPAPGRSILASSCCGSPARSPKTRSSSTKASPRAHRSTACARCVTLMRISAWRAAA